jgi:hypothetical protein
MRECCEKPENRTVESHEQDTKIERCLECGAKHIEITVDPGQLGIDASALG